MKNYLKVNLVILTTIIGALATFYFSYKEERHWFNCPPIALAEGVIRINFSNTLSQSKKRTIYGNPYNIYIRFFDEKLFNKPDRTSNLKISLNYKLYEGNKLVLEDRVNLKKSEIFRNGFIEISYKQTRLNLKDHTIEISYSIEDPNNIYTISGSEKILVPYTKETFWGPRIPM